jgi:hypothetical protein
MAYGQLQRVRRILRRIQRENLRIEYGGHYMPVNASFWPRPENTRIMRMRLCTVFCTCTLANILIHMQMLLFTPLMPLKCRPSMYIYTATPRAVISIT